MQSPSFLDFRRLENDHARSNCQTLFDIPQIPTDNRIRDMLDPAQRRVFAESVAILEGMNGDLDKFRRLGKHVLIALDGNGIFHLQEDPSSQLLDAAAWQGREGVFGSNHGRSRPRQVIPLEPEFIAPQDGTEKQGCENAAAKRCSRPTASPTPGSTRFISATICSPASPCAVHRQGHFIFVCKPSSHPLIQEYITGVELQTHDEIVKRGQNKIGHRFRWIHDVPLRDGKDAVKVNWFEIEILNTSGEVTYRNSFITDFAIGHNNVGELAARDLQQQLTQILYEVRRSFSAELFESLKLLSEFSILHDDQAHGHQPDPMKKASGKKDSLRDRRKVATWDDDYLASLLADDLFTRFPRPVWASSCQVVCCRRT